MDLVEEDRNFIVNLLKMTPENLNSFLKKIENYYQEPEEKQKQYEIFLKILLQLHKSKSEELFVSFLNETYQKQDCNKQIKLIASYITDNCYMHLDDLSRFVDLRWRLDSKIASRVNHEINNLEPKITIEILKKNNEKIFIHSAPSVLCHTIQKLEQALIDAKNVTRK